MTELCQLLCKCRRALHLIQWTTGLTASEDGHIHHLVLVMEDDMRMAVWLGDPDDLVPCLVLLEDPVGQCESQEKSRGIKEQFVVCQFIQKMQGSGRTRCSVVLFPRQEAILLLSWKILVALDIVTVHIDHNLRLSVSPPNPDFRILSE